jgi:hypothetical protein
MAVHPIVLVLVIDPQDVTNRACGYLRSRLFLPRPALDQLPSKLDNEHDDENEHNSVGKEMLARLLNDAHPMAVGALTERQSSCPDDQANGDYGKSNKK